MHHSHWARVPESMCRSCCSPSSLGPMCHNKRSHSNEEPMHSHEEQPRLLQLEKACMQQQRQHNHTLFFVKGGLLRVLDYEQPGGLLRVLNYEQPYLRLITLKHYCYYWSHYKVTECRRYNLEPHYFTCGPWTSNLGRTWEPMRNADSQAAPALQNQNLQMNLWFTFLLTFEKQD